MKNLVTFEDYSLISNAIDLDRWKHSIHYNVFNANQRTLNKELLDILDDKIRNRNLEISQLENAKNILLDLELIDDIIEEKYINNNEEDDLPF